MGLEWSHILTAAVTSSVISALFAGYLKLVEKRHQNRREDRTDEVGVLYQQIKELRADNARLLRRLDDRDEDVRSLKDEHTACLLEQERIRGEVAVLKHTLAELSAQLGGGPP